jgi:hypothetical protein
VTNFRKPFPRLAAFFFRRHTRAAHVFVLFA